MPGPRRPYQRSPGGPLTTTAVPQAEEKVAHECVLDALDRGPLTTLQIARIACGREPEDLPPVAASVAVAATTTGTVHARIGKQQSEPEGFVFATLLELRRRGLVVAEWKDVGGVRRKLYGRPGQDFGAAAVSASPTPPSARVEKLAREITKGLEFAPRLRGELRAEIEHHLTDSAASLAGESESPEAAEAAAIRLLGDPWKIRTDIVRAAQGRRTALMQRTVSDYVAGVAIYDLRVLLLILAVIVFVRVQVITAYHIPTKSMEPTLHGDPRHGDRILVNKLAGAPERFDIYVFDGFQDDRKNFVKRAVGIPGDSLLFAEGDVWNHGKLVRKDGKAYEALLFTVFDRAVELTRAEQRSGAKAGAAFEKELRERVRSQWRFEGDGECGVQEDAAAPFAGLRLAAPADASKTPPQLAWHEIVRDVYLDPDSGTSWGGDSRVSCCDLRLTAAVKPVPGTDARIALVLTRGTENTYEAVVRGAGPGVVVFADGKEVGRGDDAVLAEGVPTTVSFSQVDRVLRLTVGGRLVVRHELPAPEKPQRNAPAGSAIVRVERGAAWIDPLKLERDVYYLDEGPGDEPEGLGPDQYFMLGDNSSNSHDSRANGPVHKSRLVGSPLLVVWPPSRIRVPR